MKSLNIKRSLISVLNIIMSPVIMITRLIDSNTNKFIVLLPIYLAICWVFILLVISISITYITYNNSFNPIEYTWMALGCFILIASNMIINITNKNYEE